MEILNHCPGPGLVTTMSFWISLAIYTAVFIGGTFVYFIKNKKNVLYYWGPLVEYKLCTGLGRSLASCVLYVPTLIEIIWSN